MLGQLFDKTGPYSVKGLKKTQKKKKKSSPKPQKPLLPKSSNKDKLKKVKKKHWSSELGEALSTAGKNLGDTQASESAKTQQMKDKLYIRRNKKRG